MLRRKPRSSSLDDLALVKAAAWAWYQRGSGSSEVKRVSEYDVTRSQKAHPRPSRYKLEAMKQAAESAAVAAASGSGSPSTSPMASSPRSDTDDGSVCSTTSLLTTEANSLLDTYEIYRISKELDYYIESCRAGRNVGHRRRVASWSEGEVNCDGVKKIDNNNNNNNSKMKMKKKKKGFWLMRQGAAVCGSRDGGVAVEPVRCFSGGRLPEEHAVVRLVNR